MLILDLGVGSVKYTNVFVESVHYIGRIQERRAILIMSMICIPFHVLEISGIGHIGETIEIWKERRSGPRRCIRRY